MLKYQLHSIESEWMFSSSLWRLHIMFFQNLLQVSSVDLIVQDADGREIESQLIPMSNASLIVRNYHIKAYTGRSVSSSMTYWLAFSASLPPLGFSTYFVTSSKRRGQDIFTLFLF